MPTHERKKEQIKGELLSGTYRFSLLTRITLKDGEDTDLWSARDALVLKALCTHLKGNGGAKCATMADISITGAQ